MKVSLLALMFMAPAAFANEFSWRAFDDSADSAGRCREGYEQRIPNDGYCSAGMVRDSIYQCQNGQMVRVSYTCRRENN